jgi:Ser/Thr protein kinase RdoA (MazF antagonist)
MPGLVVNDFGDAIRFGASTALENEKDLEKVRLSLEMFAAFAEGYIENSDLTDAELKYLVDGAKMMTLECGTRFLTDYINGDVYFKIDYPEENLDRARTQFKLVKDMEEKWNDMIKIIEEAISNGK